MKLIPEQVSYSRQKLNKIEMDRQFDLESIEARKEKYETLLKTSEYVRKPSIDQIDVGTKFLVQFDGEEEIETYVLVDVLVGSKHISEQMITTESPIGKSILGKKEGEAFSYILGQDKNKRQISGTVVGIEKNKNSYLSYIRDNEIDEHKTKTNIKNSNITQNETSIITESQKKLLEIEAERISKIMVNDSNKTAALHHRLEKIKEILESSMIAKPIEDKISTGSMFSIMLFTDKGSVTKRVELIDKAVSDELIDEYVEKTSPLGVVVCGLKEQEEFITKINNQNISGVVFDISNNPKDIKTNDPIEYQKSKGKLENF